MASERLPLNITSEPQVDDPNSSKPNPGDEVFQTNDRRWGQRAQGPAVPLAEPEAAPVAEVEEARAEEAEADLEAAEAALEDVFESEEAFLAFLDEDFDEDAPEK